VIAAAASVLSGICDVTQDRMGYLGKDHFWLILRAPHQEQRIRRALEQFDQRVVSFFSQADLERGGYISESRRGDKEFHPVITLSVGAVPVSPGEFHHADDVLDAAADA
jgi:GGDEF domain-containing protein